MNNCAFILFYVSIVAIISFTGVFFIGEHNIDLAWNIKYFESISNQTLIDYGNDMVVRDADMLYILGCKQERIAMLGLAASLIIFFMAKENK